MSLIVHHLDCGSFCPAHAGALFPTDHLSCHCLLIETNDGLALVDTGLPRELSPTHNLGTMLSQPTLREGQSAKEQIEAKGFKSTDVRHIIVTHLDYDHMGGAKDFPEATLHCHAKETETLDHPGLYKHRFRLDLWAEIKKVETYDRFGENWRGLSAVRSLRGLPPEILLVPLPGHTRGHSGIAVETADGALLHAGDAFFFKEDLSPNLRERNASSDVLQFALAMNNWQRLLSLHKLEKLARTQSDVRLISSHDPRYLNDL